MKGLRLRDIVLQASGRSERSGGTGHGGGLGAQGPKAHLLEHVRRQGVINQQLSRKDQTLLTRGGVLRVLLVQEALNVQHPRPRERHLHGEVLLL